MIRHLEQDLGSRLPEFKEHIQAMNSFSDYHLAREAFLAGKRMQAFQLLRPYFAERPKWFLTAMAYSLLPKDTFLSLARLRN
jgi:hypothetical protein